MDYINIKTLEEVINSIKNKDSIYCIMLYGLKKNLIELSDEVNVDRFDVNIKYFDISLSNGTNDLDLELINGIYFRIHFNYKEITYVLDKIKNEDLLILIDDLFKGKFKINLFSKSKDSKIREIEIVWENNLLSEFNQRIKQYLPLNIFKFRNTTFIKTIKGENWLKSK